jgi:hypothetical protein
LRRSGSPRCAYIRIWRRRQGNLRTVHGVLDTSFTREIRPVALYSGTRTTFPKMSLMGEYGVPPWAKFLNCRNPAVAAKRRKRESCSTPTPAKPANSHPRVLDPDRDAGAARGHRGVRPPWRPRPHVAPVDVPRWASGYRGDFVALGPGRSEGGSSGSPAAQERHTIHPLRGPEVRAAAAAAGRAADTLTLTAALGFQFFS